MRIRFAQAADISTLVALEYQHYKAEGYPEAFLFQAFRQWPKMLWVAEDSSQVCGYLLAAPGEVSGEAWIMSALVSDNFRGQGIGATLMKQAISELKSQGIQSIQLSVAAENEAALKLYENLGFTVTERKDNYLGAGEHRLIMRLLTL